MEQQKKIKIITIGYWLLLLYILAALIWWFIALNRQATEMAALRIAHISPQQNHYQARVNEAEEFIRRKRAQYIGEGSIFLFLIIAGTVLVYRAVRKQLELAKQQQNFMMAVTHEFKTPIAVTRLNLETLKYRKLDEQKQQVLLQSAIAETERLNDLTNNILLASRMDYGKNEYAFELVDLKTTAGELTKQFELRYPLRSIKAQFPEDSWVNGDTLLLKILISNLLENAIKYAEVDSAISFCIEKSSNHMLLKVGNIGNGIPDSEKQKVFEKFYRMGNEATRSAKGTGLGLFLCKRIAEGHKGRIWVEDNQPKGCIFIVELPEAEV
jgi:signal transduction histidine kinase